MTQTITQPLVEALVPMAEMDKGEVMQSWAWHLQAIG
jgi:hypothetical protein